MVRTIQISPFNIHGEYSIAYNHIIPEQYIDADKRLWMKERKSLRVSIWLPNSISIT